MRGSRGGGGGVWGIERGEIGDFDALLEFIGT